MNEERFKLNRYRIAERDEAEKDFEPTEIFQRRVYHRIQRFREKKPSHD